MKILYIIIFITDNDANFPSKMTMLFGPFYQIILIVVLMFNKSVNQCYHVNLVYNPMLNCLVFVYSNS